MTLRLTFCHGETDEPIPILMRRERMIRREVITIPDPAKDQLGERAECAEQSSQESLVGGGTTERPVARIFAIAAIVNPSVGFAGGFFGKVAVGEESRERGYLCTSAATM